MNFETSKPYKEGLSGNEQAARDRAAQTIRHTRKIERSRGLGSYTQDV